MRSRSSRALSTLAAFAGRCDSSVSTRSMAWMAWPSFAWDSAACELASSW